MRVSNIVMRNIRDEACILTTFYTKTEPEPVSERTPIFRNIHFNGITGDAKIACALTGLEELPVENITFSDIQLETKTGIVVRDARRIQFHDVNIDTESGPVLTATKTEGLDISGIGTTRPHAGTPVVEMDNVKRVFVHDCVAEPGTEVFLRVSRDSADEVTLEGNHLKQAKTAVREE